ncbi:DUF983 domain-containing protein [Belnapia sp. T6]|uniref:DUF983 domain-containing protein n=1 Tax=Belnapia mucosa TaxID=2804532 RepID=A0ABS1V7V4_9PROT|nr:DUF983 domain-containing protein [Belnapia mucosa]MBL6457749.1 DUF983 domain-containing protein [Belnapia mucosa]
MAETSKLALGLRRGLGLRCPQCGEGRLFGRFLKVSDHCEACGADNTIYPSDDAPPYLTLFLVGHLILPFMFWMDKAWEPAMWVMFALWLPLVGGMTLALLPYMKGVVVGFAWANGVTRETARQ